MAALGQPRCPARSAEFTLHVVVIDPTGVSEEAIPDPGSPGRGNFLLLVAAPAVLGDQIRERCTMKGSGNGTILNPAAFEEQTMRSTIAEEVPEQLEVRKQGEPLVAPPLSKHVEFGNAGDSQPLIRHMLGKERAGLGGSQPTEYERRE